MRVAPFLLVALGILGCGGGGAADAGYQGKTLDEWVAQARGKDPAARLTAYEALGTFRGNEAATAALRDVANNNAGRGPERIVAAKNLYRATGDAGPVIAPVRAVIRAEADDPGGLESVKELEDLIFWLGARAEPLVPDLQYAAGKVRGRDARSNARRQRVQQIAGGIPKP